MNVCCMRTFYSSIATVMYFDIKFERPQDTEGEFRGERVFDSLVTEKIDKQGGISRLERVSVQEVEGYREKQQDSDGLQREG